MKPKFKKITIIVTTNHIEEDGSQWETRIDEGTAAKSRRAANKLAGELTQRDGYEYFVIETTQE